MNTQVKFQEKRSTLPSVYIVTPYDAPNKNSMWTWEKPNMQQLCRTVILARQTVAKNDLGFFLLAVIHSGALKYGR